jgi:hypothetical protein
LEVMLSERKSKWLSNIKIFERDKQWKIW